MDSRSGGAASAFFSCSRVNCIVLYTRPSLLTVRESSCCFMFPCKPVKMTFILNIERNNNSSNSKMKKKRKKKNHQMFGKKMRDPDSNNLKNYRPISNLPFVSKLVGKKLVLQQSEDHLKLNYLSSPSSRYTAQDIIQKLFSSVSRMTEMDDWKMSIFTGPVSCLGYH